MKVSKQALNKIYKLIETCPKLLNIFSSRDDFFQTVKELLTGYGQLYGFSKVLKLYTLIIFLLPEDLYENKQLFLLSVQNRLAALVYNTYEKQDEQVNYVLVYFDDIKKIYEKNNNFKEKIDFLPENRELFIKSNLKLVISTAKRYMNMGVPFADLISAGNVGLCEAFNKFNNSRNTIQDKILHTINVAENEIWQVDEVKEILREHYTYGNMYDKLCKKIPKSGFKSKEKFEQWVKKNIKSAVFASVAFMWIRAYILTEINKTAHIVKLPQDAVENMPAKTHFISIEDYNQDDEVPLFDIASDDYEQCNQNIDIHYKKLYYNNTVNKLLTCLTPRERRIVIKKFGIGLPYEMRIQDIADAENISQSRCMSTYKEAIKKITQGVPPEKLAEIHEYLSQ